MTNLIRVQTIADAFSDCATTAGISERKRTVRVQARSEIQRLVCAMQSDFESRYIRSQKALSLELCALDLINRNGLIAVNL